MNVVNAGMVGMAAARTWDVMRHGEDGGTQSPLVELGRGPESGGNSAMYCSRQLNFGESILDTLGPLSPNIGPLPNLADILCDLSGPI